MYFNNDVVCVAGINDAINCKNDGKKLSGTNAPIKNPITELNAPEIIEKVATFFKKLKTKVKNVEFIMTEKTIHNTTKNTFLALNNANVLSKAI